MRELLRKLGSLLTPHERRSWLGLLPLLAFTGVLETIGTGLVFALIKIVGDPSYIRRVPVLSSIVAGLPWHSDRAVVLGGGAFLATFFVFRSIVLVFVAHRQGRAVADTTAALSSRMFDVYLGAPFAAHLRRSSADLVYDATTAVERSVEMGLAATTQIATETLVSLGLVLFLVVADPVVTLSTAGALGLLIVTTLRLTKRTSRRWGSLRESLGRGAQKAVQESLGGIREIKILGREPVFSEAFRAAQGQLARARRFHTTFTALPRLAIETIFVSSVVLIIALATLRGSRGAEIVPLLGLYAYAGFRLIPSANRILLNVDSFRAAGPAIERLYMHAAELGVGTPPLSELAASAVAPPAFSFQHAIVVDGVSFAYEGSSAPVLSDVSVTIRRGQSVGIVGATGAGKSTLVDLILGLLEPTAGRITVDGVDVRQLRRAWQGRIGYVPQAAFLFQDTVRRNVALGVAKERIDEERLREALRLSQLTELVASWPDGLDTMIGERGVRLSGGQRQRVAIARALYHDPALVVFDEATAALDNQTEREVTRAIEALRGDKTVITIAHRLTTVRRCDSLIMLKRGRVEAVGSFDRLLADSAEFRALAAIDPTDAPRPD